MRRSLIRARALRPSLALQTHPRPFTVSLPRFLASETPQKPAHGIEPTSDNPQPRTQDFKPTPQQKGLQLLKGQPVDEEWEGTAKGGEVTVIGKDGEPVEEKPRELTAVEKLAERRAKQEAEFQERLKEAGYVESLLGMDLPIVGLKVPAGTWEVDVFAPKEAIEDPITLKRALHRAVVEVFTAHISSRPAASVCDNLYVGPEDLTAQVKIHVAENGEAKFDFGSTDVRAEILKAVEPEREISERIEEEAYPELAQTPEWLEDLSWTRIPFPDADVKFALVKRFLQLTGKRVYDVHVNSAKRLSDILPYMLGKPKPEKLFEDLLEGQSELLQLPNVTVAGKRITRLEREQSIGRAQIWDKDADHKYEGFVERRPPAFKGDVFKVL